MWVVLVRLFGNRTFLCSSSAGFLGMGLYVGSCNADWLGVGLYVVCGSAGWLGMGLYMCSFSADILRIVRYVNSLKQVVWEWDCMWVVVVRFFVNRTVCV